MPNRIEGRDEFSELILTPRKGERDYDNTVTLTFQHFADRTIWLKKRVEEINKEIGGTSSNIYVDAGAPQQILGKDGDLYIDTTNGVFYYKESNSWQVAVNVSDFGSKIYSNSGVPNNSFGKNGDLYIDTSTSNFYHKSNDTWTLVLNAQTLGKLDTINNVQPVDKNIDLLAGDGLEIIPNENNGTITIQLYTSPSASISNNVGTVEKGVTVTSVGLIWSFNKTETSQSINNGVGSLGVGVRTYTHSPVSYTSDVTYILTIDDGSGAINASTIVKFLDKVHWGTSSNTTLTSAQILGLANNSFSGSKNRSFTIDGNGEYIYYAYPSSFGEATFTVNGLLNTAWEETVVSHTNASGYTTDYRVYRSTYIQNGTGISVEVS